MIVGGRNLTDPPVPTRVTIRADDVGVADIDAPPGGFLQFLNLAESSSVPMASDRYVRLTLRASPPGRVAIEQFDASGARPMLGFGRGWHEQEFNPATGLRWRWSSQSGEIHVHAPAGALLRLDGESPLKYYSRPSRLIVRRAGRAIADQMISSDFSLAVPITPGPVGDDAGDASSFIITVETDQTYVPGERSRRTGDRRRLGLRIFRCELRGPAS